MLDKVLKLIDLFFILYLFSPLFAFVSFWIQLLNYKFETHFFGDLAFSQNLKYVHDWKIICQTILIWWIKPFQQFSRFLKFILAKSHLLKEDDFTKWFNVCNHYRSAIEEILKDEVQYVYWNYDKTITIVHSNKPTELLLNHIQGKVEHKISQLANYGFDLLSFSNLENRSGQGFVTIVNLDTLDKVAEFKSLMLEEPCEFDEDEEITLQ